MTPAMQEMQARGIDPRMGRTYAENIRLMGDPRMRGDKGGMVGEDDSPVIPIKTEFDKILQYYERIYGPTKKARTKAEAAYTAGERPYKASGGRVSYTKGGLAHILGV